MNKLIITTRYPATVVALLYEEELIDSRSHSAGGADTLELVYPDDAISQSLAYWLALAQGCHLVREYRIKFYWEQ